MMTEGEPQLQSSHPKIQQFFERLDQGVGTTQTKETGLSLIPQEKRDQLHRLAARLEELFAAGSPSFADVLEALKLPPYNVELKGDQRARTGFYKTLHSVSGERLGREGEQKAKPGFKLTVAMIPRGYTAPLHLHRDLQQGVGFGELTATLQGSLLYIGSQGRLETHTKNDAPRLSMPGSLDMYLPNRELWVGLYLQPESCELLEGDLKIGMEQVRAVLEGQLAIIEQMPPFFEEIKLIFEKNLSASESGRQPV